MTGAPPAACSRGACDVAADADTPACTQLAGTIRRSETDVLAASTSDGVGNARSGAVNLLSKKIKRVGHGFGKLED